MAAELVIAKAMALITSMKNPIRSDRRIARRMIRVATSEYCGAVSTEGFTASVIGVDDLRRRRGGYL